MVVEGAVGVNRDALEEACADGMGDAFFRDDQAGGALGKPRGGFLFFGGGEGEADVEDDVLGVVAVALPPVGAVDGLEERLVAFGAEVIAVEGAFGETEPVGAGVGV